MDRSGIVTREDIWPPSRFDSWQALLSRVPLNYEVYSHVRRHLTGTTTYTVHWVLTPVWAANHRSSHGGPFLGERILMVYPRAD